MSGGIRVERNGRVARLVLDRPPLNILDLATLDALDRSLASLAVEEDLQVVVVEGEGERAFSAGVAVEDHTPDKIESMLESFHSALKRLLDFPTPTVAAIRGHCLGGGMELAACCDLRLAETTSKFGQPEIELGCYPPWAAAHYPALLGVGATVDLLLTGRVLDAAEAQRLGFLHRSTEPGELGNALDEFVGRVTARSVAVTRLAVAAIRARRSTDFGPALAESERIYTQRLTQTHDMTEGLDAFLDKRTPDWRHR